MILRVGNDTNWFMNPVAANLEYVLDVLSNGKCRLNDTPRDQWEMKQAGCGVVFGDQLIKIQRSDQELVETFELEGLISINHEHWDLPMILSMALCGPSVIKEVENLSLEALSRFKAFMSLRSTNFVLCSFEHRKTARCDIDDEQIVSSFIAKMSEWNPDAVAQAVKNNNICSFSSIRAFHQIRQSAREWVACDSTCFDIISACNYPLWVPAS